MLVWLRESTHWTVLEVVVDGRVDATSFSATRVDKALAGRLEHATKHLASVGPINDDGPGVTDVYTDTYRTKLLRDISY